jgi:hypothetical protein
MSTITTPVSTVDEIDLYEYIEYLGKLKSKPRSPLTLSLYRQSLEACKLSKIKASEINNVWPYLRDLLKTRKAGAIFVNKAKTVVKGAATLNGIPHERTRDYNFLLVELGNDNEPVQEYSDDDIRSILEITHMSNTPLFNACALMSLSGLRIGATRDLTWGDFYLVEGTGVRIFKVFSKGSTYWTAISDRAYSYMFNQNDGLNSKKVVWFDPNVTTDFSTLMRMKLYYYLKRSSRFREIGKAMDLQKKSLLHSMRHWAISQMASALNDQETAELAGHKVSNTITRRYYINKSNNGLPLPEYQRKIAELYKRTPLFNFDLKQIEKGADNLRRFG